MMTDYWSILVIIGAIYLIFAWLLIILIMIVAVKSECQDRRQKETDYWRLITGIILFGLSWLYYLVIGPLVREIKEGKEMRRQLTIPLYLYLAWTFFFFICVLLVMWICFSASLATKDLRIAWLISYLALGFFIELTRYWDIGRLVESQESVAGPLVGLVQMFLSAVCWPILPIFKSRRIRKHSAGNNIHHRLVILGGIALAFLFLVSLFWLKGEMAWSWREFYISLFVICVSGSYLSLGLDLAVDQWRFSLRPKGWNGGVSFLVNVFETFLLIIIGPVVILLVLAAERVLF